MSYPKIKIDYPVYDDYNNDNYYHLNSKSGQNWSSGSSRSPIILFNEKRPKKSALDRNLRKNSKNCKEFLKKKSSKSARVRTADKLINVISEKFFSTKNTIKMVFIFICCGFCGYQTIDIFNKFASYPMDVNVVVKEMKLLQLPGVTICNNNVFFKRDMIEQLDLAEDKNITELEMIAQKYALENPLKDVMKMTQPRDQFVVDMECDTQYDANEEVSAKDKCENKEVITSLQKNGICFTYFHKMATYKRPNNNCKMLDTCTDTEPHFDTNEIIRFELDFYPKEYTNTELPTSGKISIHDNSEIGNSLSNAYNLEPGFYYQFFIKIQSTQMLKKPYETNCLDYIDKYFYQFNETKDYTVVPLSRKACTSACMADFIIKGCKCWPPDLPYTQNNKLDINETIKWCTWRYGLEEKMALFTQCNDPHMRNLCSMKCQPSCWTDHYEISLQKLPFEYYGRKGWNSQHQQRMNDSAIISIRYWSTEHTIHEYSPLFRVLDMVCYVGGLVSMYTGISLIAIFDFLAFVYYFTLKHTK